MRGTSDWTKACGRLVGTRLHHRSVLLMLLLIGGLLAAWPSPLQAQGSWPRYGSWAASGGFRDSHPVRPPLRPPVGCVPPPRWCCDYVWPGHIVWPSPIWPPFYPIQPVIGWQPIIVWGPLGGPFPHGINRPLIPFQPGQLAAAPQFAMPPLVPVPLLQAGQPAPVAPSLLTRSGGMDSTGSRRIGRREPLSSRAAALPMGNPSADKQLPDDRSSASDLERLHQQLQQSLQQIPSQPLGRTSARGPLPPERPSRQK
jgi:hypothetical protein